MVWEVEYTDVFGAWWQALLERQQDSVAARVELLMEYGQGPPYPYSSDIRGSRYRGVCPSCGYRAVAGL